MMRSADVGIVILAAGESRRMGQPKQLLSWHGRTLLRHAVETALATTLGPVVVTTGAHRDAVEADLVGLPVLIAHAPDWAQGMSVSLRAGLDSVLRAPAAVEGVVITLADQPLVRPDDILHLVRRHRETGKDLVASAYAGTRGVPMFIGAPLFGAVRTLRGPGGAKELLSHDVSQIALIRLDAAAADVDTPMDYQRLGGRGMAL